MATFKPEDATASLNHFIKEVVDVNGKRVYEINIRDFNLIFPFDPYKSQLEVMDVILNACSRAEHCLIESPTGSGKTIALLVASLVWQKDYKDKLAKLREEWNLRYRDHMRDLSRQQSGAACSNAAASYTDTPSRCDTENSCDITNNDKKEAVSPSITKSKKYDGMEFMTDDDDMSDEDIFKPKPKRIMQNATTVSVSKKKKPMNITPTKEVSSNFTPGGTKLENYEDGTIKNIPLCCSPSKPSYKSPAKSSMPFSPTKSEEMGSPTLFDESGCLKNPPSLKYPKIYYATRTHQQIDQVVKQLRLSGYKDVRMTVLSSRDRTCIHPEVMSSQPSKRSELCSRLTAPVKEGFDSKKCVYYTNKEKTFGNHNRLESTGCPNIWDIEDLVKLGKKYNSCPYYGARNLTDSADIILCPYNYIISPLIRKSMNINLKGHILIFDEAHNIDDVCRDSASYKLQEQVLVNTINELRNLELYTESDYKMFRYLELILNWMREKCDNMSSFNDFNKAEAVLSVTEFFAVSENCHFGKEQFTQFKELFGSSNDDMLDKLSGDAKMCIESLILVLSFIFNFEYKDDFQIVIEKSLQDEQTDQFQSMMHKRNQKRGMKWAGSINILCLNAATIFNTLKDDTRSIILTSGTLTPFELFDAELGATFPHKAELSNEISSEQLFAATISVGPSGRPLMMDYKNINSYEVQDDLGKLLLVISQTVPEGILVFFPSYAAKNNLYKRWQDTGILKIISQHKTLFEEPRTSFEMKDLMAEYYAANKKYEKKGALMFAIFRGKVSEGINFENEHARAVIAIGIPYPNVKAIEVRLKRAFNDRSSKLSGSEWYTNQGFRALNQALGRVIRHKDDWGIILLVDQRYKNEQNKKRLSRWIRENMQIQTNALIPSIKRYCNLKLQKYKEQDFNVI